MRTVKCDFCTSNGLVSGGTLFPHKKSHKLTWRSPDGITENQIDHVAIIKTWRSSLQDTRVMWSADTGSDQYLVVAVIKMKLLALKKPRSSRKTYCTHRFKDQTVRKDFVIALTNRYDALYNEPVDGEEQELDIEQEWSKIKEMYSSTCEEVLGKAKRERKTWMSENTWRLVEERRVLKAMLETAKTRQQKFAAVERYNEKNHEVKRSCRRDKRQRIDEIAREAEEAAEQRDLKRVYDTTRLLSRRKTVQSKPVKDKNGAVLTRTEDQLNRWKEHFQEVLNRPAPENPPNLTEGPLLGIRTGQITMAEVKRALKSLKNGKAPGCDNIPPEAWKEGGTVSAKVLHALLIKIWNEEDIPQDWKVGLLVKLPKKGDLCLCKNWRGIMLLTVASKVLCKIILERMKDALDSRLRDEQAGFRKERSCCDQIATLRIIVEQTLEWNTGLYVVFVDFEKAFDSVDREVLWKILRHYGVPEKIVRMIKVFYNDFQARVLHEGEMTGSFSMNTGVRQGCLLSPLLFLMALDWVSRQAFGDNKTGIQFTLLQKLEDLDFADDIVLLSQKITHMRQKLAALVEQAARVGLKINASKTKEMRIRSPANTGNINCVGEVLEQVSAFTCLGSLITTTGGTEEDVEARCRKAQVAFSILRPIWRSNFISLRTKIRIFNSNVKSVLLYGSETWRLTKKIITQLQTFTNRRLRYILGVWWPKKIWNEELWQRTQQERIEVTIRRRKWRWIGHTLRKPATNITRLSLEWNPQGVRRKGRPKKSWRRTIQQEYEDLGMSWEEVKRTAKNRVRWKAVVEALCSGRSGED